MDAVVVSMMHRVNIASSGSTSVTVLSSELGRGVYSMGSRGAQTGCESTDWESESSVKCLRGHGSKGTRRYLMTIGDRQGSMTQGWSIDRGGLSVMHKANLAGSGSI